MSGKFVLKSSRGGKFRFNLCAGNGQVILTSEAYNTKKSALNGMATVVKNAVDEGCIDRKVAKNGKPYFNLKSSNGQVIAQSQMYASKAAMEKGIRSVARNSDSRIDDQVGTLNGDLTGVPAEIAHDPELVRSWRSAQVHMRDPAVRKRVNHSLERLENGSSEAMTKDEFLAATEHAVA